MGDICCKAECYDVRSHRELNMFAFLNEWMKKLHKRRRDRLALEYLQRLDSKILKDIGIHEGDLRYVQANSNITQKTKALCSIARAKQNGKTIQ